MDPQETTFEQYQADMKAAGHSDDDVRRGWSALMNIPGTTVVPGGGPIPGEVPITPQKGMGVARYKQYLLNKEDQELNDFAASQLKSEKPTSFAPPPEIPAPAPKPSVLTTGARTTGKVAMEGIHHFVNGLYDAFVPNPATPRGYGGEALLGALTLAMALPAGAGAALTQAMSNYVPNMDMTVAIPGTSQTGKASPAGLLRTFLAVPSLLLDPKMREMIKEHPEALDEALNRPMTYKELMENLLAFGTAPLATKIATKTLRLATGMVPEPLQIQAAVKGRAVDPNFGFTTTGPVDVPGPGVRYNRPAAWTDYVKSATSVRESGAIAPEDVATRVEALAAEYGHSTPQAEGVKSSGGEPPVAGAPATAAPPTEASVGFTSKPGGVGFTSKPGEPIQVAIEEVQKALGKTEVSNASAPTETPTVVDRWTEMHDAMPGEPVAYLDAGNTPASDAVAAILPEGDKYVLRNIDGETLGSFDNVAAAKAAGEQKYSPPIAEADTGYGASIAADVEAAMKHYLGDQAGRVDPTLLAHMAVGAMLGGTQGTTPEERLTYAFAGLVGGAFARKFSARLVDMVKNSPKAAPILDTTNPVNQNFNPPRPALEATTRALENVVDAPGLTKERILSNNPPLQRSDLRNAQQVSARASEAVVQIAKKIEAGEFVEPGDLKQAFALSRDLWTAVRKIGKGIDVSNLPPREAALAGKMNLDKLAREWDPATPEDKLAQMILDLPDVGLGSRLYYAVPDALLETMYTGQLMGTAIVRNGVAMMATMPMTALARSFAAMRIWDKSRPLMSEGPMAFVAATEGLVEQLRLAKSWDALGAQAAALGSTKVETFPRGYAALAEIASDYNLDGLAKGLNFMHSMAGVAPEVLARTDGMGKAVFGRIGILWESMEHAAKENLPGEAYWDRVNDLRTNYDELSPEAKIRISEFRDRITANKRFEGAFMQMIQAGPQDPWANLAYRLLIAPYIRTPIRLAELHADYTPGLNFLSTNYRLAMDRGGTEASMARGQLYAGVAIVTGAIVLAQQGYVTGAAPGDPKAAKAMVDAGMPPMSWWDPLSQKYRSYAGLEPLSTVISVGATLANLATQIPEPSFTKLLLAAGLAEVESVPQKTYLQAMAEMNDVMKTGATDSMWEKSLDYIRRRLGSFNPAAAREVARLIDPTSGRTLKVTTFDKDYTPSAALRREWRALVDDFTGGNKNQRNTWTGDLIQNTTWPFNPFTQKEYRGAPWAQEIQRLHGAGIDPLSDTIGGKPAPVNVGMTEAQPSPAVRLTPDQLDRLEVLMTQVVKDSHGNLVASIDNLVNSSLYKRMPDSTREQMLQSRWAQFRQRAEGQLLMENRPLRLQLEDAQRKATIQGAPKDVQQRMNIQITPRQ